MACRYPPSVSHLFSSEAPCGVASLPVVARFHARTRGSPEVRVKYGKFMRPPSHQISLAEIERRAVMRALQETGGDKEQKEQDDQSFATILVRLLNMR